MPVYALCIQSILVTDKPFDKPAVKSWMVLLFLFVGFVVMCDWNCKNTLFVLLRILGLSGS